MTSMEQALAGMWRSRDIKNRPYLMINDVRSYFAEAPEELQIGGQSLPIHVCANEFTLR